jgi:aromatic ring-opening dioxygenase catalytic subunit (LigB family)
MAKLVLGLGGPHTPFFPNVSKAQGDASPITVHFRRLAQDLAAAAPDLILCYTSDHLVHFFFDNLPTFCVGTFASADGPHELSRQIPWYQVKGHPEFAKALLEFGIASGFDLASSEAVKLDHSLLVPMHFLTPDMRVPVVPIFIKGLIEPLPTAERCYALGKMVGQHVARWPGAERIAVVASGSFSLEVGGPKMGTIDQEWFDFVVDSLRKGDVDEIVRRATSQRMRAAGNIGGELLNWIAMLGTIGKAPATFIAANSHPPNAPQDAHAFASWTVGGS